MNMRNRTEKCIAAQTVIAFLLAFLPLDLALVFLALLDELLVGRLQLRNVLLQLLVHLHAAIAHLSQGQVLFAQVLQKKRESGWVLTFLAK